MEEKENYSPEEINEFMVRYGEVECAYGQFHKLSYELSETRKKDNDNNSPIEVRDLGFKVLALMDKFEKETPTNIKQAGSGHMFDLYKTSIYSVISNLKTAGI